MTTSDPSLPLGPHDVSFEELRQHAEGCWRLTGPDSHGGTTLYRYEGQLFVVGYGERSALPGGAEQVLSTLPDNSPGFPPSMGGGHVAGCAHEVRWKHDWWQHRTLLLRVDAELVSFSEAGREAWACPTAEFLRAATTRHEDVRRAFGPAVLDEALRCARERFAARSRI
jgi:hypothetical protein